MIAKEPEKEAIAASIVLPEIDRVIHEPARLMILAVLSSAEEVDFRFLEAATSLTKGNLSRQTVRLEDAGYISIRKYYKGRVPATSYRITPEGKTAYAKYWQQMSALRKDAALGKEG